MRYSKYTIKFTLMTSFTYFFFPACAAPSYSTIDIFPPGVMHSHSSSIVECPNGDLLACWYQGSGERTADDVQVLGSRLKNGEETWGNIFLMADTPGFPDCNPVMHIDRKKRLWLFWVSVLAHRWECSLLKYRRSEDYQEGGAPRWSWQDVLQLKPGPEFGRMMKHRFEEIKMETEMWAEYARPYEVMLLEAAQDPIKRQTGWMPRIHPLTLPNGRILLPLYSDGFNVSIMAITDDDGDTWFTSQPLVGLGPVQPTLALKEDGSVVAFCRDSGPSPGRVMMSVSRDNGQTWSAAVDTDIQNPGSSLEVIVLQDGRWLMIYNDSTKTRGNLTAAFSSDEGKSWQWKQRLEPNDAGAGSFGYPSVIQTADGTIHMTYTCQDSRGNRIRHGILSLEGDKSN